MEEVSAGHFLLDTQATSCSSSYNPGRPERMDKLTTGPPAAFQLLQKHSHQKKEVWGGVQERLSESRQEALCVSRWVCVCGCVWVRVCVCVRVGACVLLPGGLIPCASHLRDGQEVAVVYFRNGYMPENYQSEEAPLTCFSLL